ncbi:hypothetical protein HAX54_048935, partial [Datura stramonium]|nr:hypothetical protein [Datura stramonium]
MTRPPLQLKGFKLWSLLLLTHSSVLIRVHLKTAITVLAGFANHPMGDLQFPWKKGKRLNPCSSSNGKGNHWRKPCGNDMKTYDNSRIRFESLCSSTVLRSSQYQ